MSMSLDATQNAELEILAKLRRVRTDGVAITAAYRRDRKALRVV